MREVGRASSAPTAPFPKSLALITLCVFAVAAPGCSKHPPTPQEVCSSTNSFAQAASVFNEQRVDKDSLIKPLDARDFSAPIVEGFDQNTGLTTCSAEVAVRAKNDSTARELPPYGHHLTNVHFTDDGFAFRMTFGLHAMADGSGTQVSVDNGQGLLDATLAGVGSL